MQARTSATINSKNSYTQFPQEICGIICQYPILGRRDLHNLCAVSHAFRDEAERLLYTSALLRGRRSIKSFCFSVTRRPYLALRARQLVLFLPPQLDLEIADLSRIVKALHLCSNLQNLSVHQDHSSTLERCTGAAVQQWILYGHGFQLKMFVNTYFHPISLARFLESQPTLETLVLKSEGEAFICDLPLPQLRNLDSSAAVIQEFANSTLYKREIQRLQVNFLRSDTLEEFDTFIALKQFEGSLSSLSIIRRDGQSGLTVAGILAFVVHQLPNIKYLHISDFTLEEVPNSVPFLPFSFHPNKIETLILNPPKQVVNGINPDDYVSAVAELNTNGGRGGVVERLMSKFENLKRLVLFGKEVHEYIRDMDTDVITERIVLAPDELEWMLVEI